MTKTILTGPTCAGKNYLRDIMVSKGFKPDVSITSREPRPGEIDGVDYQFVPVQDFIHWIKIGWFYEHVKYNGNYYGTSQHNWDTKEVFIMEPDGVKHITEEDRKSCFVIYLDTPRQVRIQRMEERGWNQQQIAERLEFDDKRFKGFRGDITINQPVF